MGKIIMVASGKGGTGKTTLTANLGAALAQRGKSVVVVDMDMGLRNLDVALGLESSIVYDVADVIEETCTLDDALIKHQSYDSLFFIPAPQTRDASSIMADCREDVEGRWRSLWKRLSERFDFCLIDSPAGIEGGFKYALYSASTKEDKSKDTNAEDNTEISAVIVTLAEIAALRDADRVIDVLEDKGIEDIRLIINRIRPDMMKKGIMMNIDACVDMLGIPILGIISDDTELISSALRGELAISNYDSLAGTAFSNIAARILGTDVPIMEFTEENKISIWTKLLERVFKRKG
jgi:septum site-determining protein MinD